MKPALDRELNRFKRGWRTTLLLLAVNSALGWTAAALFVFCVIDYLASFDDRSRHLVAGALMIIAGAVVMYGIWEAFSFVRRAAAQQADTALGGERREVLSAYELSREPEPAHPLARWLRQGALDAAASRLATLKKGRERMPWRRMIRSQLSVLGLLIFFLVCLKLNGSATLTVLGRLLDPDSDTPPYTSLTFNLQPSHPEVLYGGDLVVSATVTGDEISAPVRLLTRDPATGRVDDAPAYRETANRFSQKLEKVSAPVEVAFAVGRARSSWLTVRVRTQPKIQEAILTVEPPAYTRLPQREFAVGTQPLSVLAGSRVTARVASNRPLAAGTLQIFNGAKQDAPQPVAAESDGPNRVRFTWVARQGARLGLTVRDVLNTASDALEFEQKLLPDQRPEVTLREPAGDVLSTPDGELPLEYFASDDLGLSRLALVRRLAGYRERAVTEPVTPGARRQEVRTKLSLAPFGLVPGQTIELSAEAADTNPTLLGVATSDTARIRIISREEYAEKLRRQTTLEDFTARYEAIDRALDAARQSLAELEKTAAGGDAKQAEEARQKAMEAHRDAAKLFGQLAQDFPIFDLDQHLSAAAADVMKKLFENAQELGDLKDKPADQMALATPTLRRRLGEVEERIAEDLQRGERAAKAAAVLDQARRFHDLLQEQRDVVKDLNRVIEAVRRGEMTAAQALPEMEQRQKRVADGLGQFEKDLRAALEKLPADFGKLRAATEEFLEAYQAPPIPPVMQEGATAAAHSDGQTAGARAGEALALMEALLRKKNSFCQACRGEGDAEMEWPEDLASTMRELLDSLLPKPGGDGENEADGAGESTGRGGKGGVGAGGGGRSESGYTMRGRMPRLPMYGPNRLRMNRGGEGLARDGQGSGSGPGADRVEREPAPVTAPRQAAGESVALEAVPEAYREAVKRYFLPSAAHENSTSKDHP